MTASGDALFISELARTENVPGYPRKGVSEVNGTAQVKDGSRKTVPDREAEETKNNDAGSRVSILPLQDAADLEIATEEEISLLEASRKVSLLARTDVGTSTAGY